MSPKKREYEGMPGHLARRFQQIAVAVFQVEMDRLGCDITPVQYAALEAVGIFPGIDQISLAGEIGFDRTTIAGVVDRLATKGLITRRVSPKDRRARELVITEEGEALLKHVRPGVAKAQDAMVGGLDEQEARDLLRLLGKAIDAANDLSRAPKRS